MYPVSPPAPDGDKAKRVFVVHGRNEPAYLAMCDFLRAIGLKPLDWSEAVLGTGRTSPHPSEVLDYAFEHAQAVLVLLTPDDTARLRQAYWKDDDDPYEKDLTPQARQNVLYEAGMAVGRSEGHTVFVELGKTRPFSDTLGKLHVRMKDTSQSRLELMERLGVAGCAVDKNGRAWLESGDFGRVMKKLSAVTEEESRVRPKSNACEARCTEIAAAAVQGFEEWAGDKPPYSTELYREWIHCGGVPDYRTFDYEMCRRVASELASKGRGTVNPPLEAEYTDDQEEGQKQHVYLTMEDTWPPKRAGRNRER